MANKEFLSEWFSIEDIGNEALNIDNLKESDWFNIEHNNEIKSDNYISPNYESNQNSVTWNLTIRFKSISLQNPATLIFTAPNWYKIIKGQNDIYPSKCPKTNPPVPCRRSTTLFTNTEIEINSKIMCSWKEIFDRLNIEPLQIEVYKVNPFGDREIHSIGYVNLKHIFIQPEEIKPEIINSYIYGKNSYRIWPTRVLLYPKIVKTDNNDNIESDNNIDQGINIDNNDNGESVPIGLIEVDIILEDCEKQNISEGNIFSRKNSKNINIECNSSNTRKKLPINNSPKTKNMNKLKSVSPSINKNKDYSMIKHNIQPQIIENEFELPFFEQKDLNYTENMFDFDLQYVNFNKISKFKPKLDLFNPGNDNLSSNILDSINEEIKTNVDIDSIAFCDSDDESQNISNKLTKWKLIEKERFIEHLWKLEDEFRKITISRQEVIMRDFINNINTKTKKIGKLENLVTDKIFKLKNKENSIDNINNENSKKIQLLKCEHKKILELQKNDYIVKLDIEKKKMRLLESEKNKWIKKYNDLESNMDKVFKELQDLKNSRKTELYYKNELLRKDEFIQLQETQINQLKDTVELLKASRDHIKLNFEKFVSSLDLIKNISNDSSNNMCLPHNIDSLVESGIYNENDEFIQYLKNN
ncbi:hypothetical protein RS030_111870 [Cryptosporidium xiaoi]|uniref:DUF3668 domain-containing protein n=1 Tax=Cryptosporidium xiaoi TaxID=659607 RepID=A0AAV9Y1Q4_9CRYT